MTVHGCGEGGTEGWDYCYSGVTSIPPVCNTCAATKYLDDDNIC